MSEIVKKDDPTSIDNFAGWEDGIEGSDRQQGGGIIQGIKIKLSNTAAWLQRDDEEMPPNLELIAINVIRVVQMWGPDGIPVNDETIILEPNQMFPDIEAMNEKVPRSKWIEGPDGQKRGPYQASHVLYLLDPQSMDKYSYPTSTVGGRIAIRELRDKIMWMRRLRGPNTYPVIILSTTFMNTRFGGRQRPHFKIVRWVSLGGEGGQVEALPPPPPPPAQQTPAPADLPLNEVMEPSLAEEMDDEIPDFENENAESPKPAAPPLPTPRRKLKKPAKTSTKKPPSKRASNRVLNALASSLPPKGIGHRSAAGHW
jgi:hypothetical protein